MRLLPITLLVALLAALTVSCTGTGGTAARSGPALAAAASTSAACAEVRAGIAAFNQGDYEETVTRFVEAVPLAEERLDGSDEAADLLEAVRWYAELEPEDYPEAAISSPEFAAYKAITLGQCDPVTQEEIEPPGTTV